jgi:outer membrane cobalamin receptor
MLPLPGDVRLIAGFDQDFYGGSAQEKHASGDGPKLVHRFRNRAPYAAASRSFALGGSAWRVTPTAGVRANDSRYFGSDWGWQTGIAAERGRNRIHAQLSRSFNVPGVYVATMYDMWDRPDEWKDLHAEILHHGEVGFRIAVAKGLETEVSAFYDEVESALRWVPPVVPPPPPFQPPRFSNSGTTINRGLESSVTADTRVGALFAGLTLMHPTPDNLPEAPHWSVDAGINTHVTGALSVSADLDWTDAQTVLNPRFAFPSDYESPTARVDRHLLLNARIGYSIRAGGTRSEIFLSGENLTNEEYEYRPGYPMPGTTWMSGIEIGF